MTRICHVTSVHAAMDVRIRVKQCRSLRTVGYEVHLVAPEACNDATDGVVVHLVPVPRGGRIARGSVLAWRVYCVARRLRAAVYHLHDPELLPVGVLLRLGGSRVIYDAHEDLPRDVLAKEWIPEWLRRSVSSIVDSVELLFARRVSAVVGATPQIQRRFDIAGCKTTLVRNFPLLSEFPSHGHGDFSSASRPSVGYVGDISAIRGSRVMVEAAELAGVELSLAGRMGTAELATLSSLRGWSSTRFMGSLPREAVVSMLNKCFAGLVVLKPTPAYVSSLPIKLFEYMAAGIPVVASNFAEWKPIVEGNDCGICVDPDSPEEVAQAMRILNSDRELARLMGSRGREAFLSRYNWSSELSCLRNLYQVMTG